MLSHRVWFILLAIELVLFGLLAHFTRCSEKAIMNMDSEAVYSNFKRVEHISYVLVILSFILFSAHFFRKNEEHLHYSHKLCSLKIVNMVLAMFILINVRLIVKQEDAVGAGDINLLFARNKLETLKHLVYVSTGFNLFAIGTYAISCQMSKKT